MSKIAIVVFVVAALLSAPIPQARAQNITCSQTGSMVFCNNGQTFHRIGNITLDNQGHAWISLGSQTLGSQGDLYTRSRNHVFDNRGDSWNIIRNQQVGPSGTKCVPIGSQVFCGR